MPQRPINSKAEESCGISRPQSPPSSWVKSVSSTVNRTSSSATNFAKSPTFASSKQITFDSDAMMDSDENAHNGSTWSSFRSTAHPHKHKGEIAQGPWKTAQSNNHSNHNESSTNNSFFDPFRMDDVSECRFNTNKAASESVEVCYNASGQHDFSEYMEEDGAPLDEATSPPGTNDNNGQAQSADEEIFSDQQQAEEEWNAVVKKIEDEKDTVPSSYENLKAFQDAQAVRDQAYLDLESVYRSCTQSLSNLLQHRVMGEFEAEGSLDAENGQQKSDQQPTSEAGADTTAATDRAFDTSSMVGDVIGGHMIPMGELEADIVSSMMDNHDRRMRLVELLEQNKQEFEDMNQKLSDAVLLRQNQEQGLERHRQETVNGSQGDENSITAEDGQETSQPQLPENNGEAAPLGAHIESSENTEQFASFGHQEPDWGSLLQFEPGQESAESFLEARESMEQANAQFYAMLDEIQQGFHDCVTRLEEITADVFHHTCEILNGQEGDIQDHMASNMDRREAFAAAVKEQSQQSKNYFESLMSMIAFPGSQPKQN